MNLMLQHQVSDVATAQAAQVTNARPGAVHHRPMASKLGSSNSALPDVIFPLLHPASFLTGSPVLAALTTLGFPLAAHVLSLLRP